MSRSGQTADALTRTLTGSAALSLTNGAYHGMNAVRMICDGLAGRGIGQPQEGDVTPFTSLTATLDVSNGVLANGEWEIYGQRFAADGTAIDNVFQRSSDGTSFGTILLVPEPATGLLVGLGLLGVGRWRRRMP